MASATKAPCLNCADRYLGCHDKCEKYKEFKDANQKIKDKVYMEKELNDVLKGYNKAKENGIGHSKYGKR